MTLSEISDCKTFAYCKAKSLKAFSERKCKVAIGDKIYVMMYPGNNWHIFNTNDETETKQYCLSDCAKLGIDFEKFTETTPPKKES